MLFKDSLKDAKVGEEAVKGVLLRTDRLFPCAVCRKNLTTFRFTRNIYETPVCGDECLDELDGANP
jgi:hypothetical protein